MAIEILEDIIEDLENMVGVYGSHDIGVVDGEMCRCRVCFTSGLRSRILDSIEVERKLFGIMHD